MNRVRYQIFNATPINFATEANRLAEMIKSYSIGSDGLFVQ